MNSFPEHGIKRLNSTLKKKTQFNRHFNQEAILFITEMIRKFVQTQRNMSTKCVSLLHMDLI